MSIVRDTEENRRLFIQQLAEVLIADLANIVWEYSYRCSHPCDLRPTLLRCCSCLDSRAYDAHTALVKQHLYIDGVGFIEQLIRRDKYYCPVCKQQ